MPCMSYNLAMLFLLFSVESLGSSVAKALVSPSLVPQTHCFMYLPLLYCAWPDLRESALIYSCEAISTLLCSKSMFKKVFPLVL